MGGGGGCAGAAGWHLRMTGFVLLAAQVSPPPPQRDSSPIFAHYMRAAPFPFPAVLPGYPPQLLLLLGDIPKPIAPFAS